jgi:hypothetical protein
MNPKSPGPIERKIGVDARPSFLERNGIRQDKLRIKFTRDVCGEHGVAEGHPKPILRLFEPCGLDDRVSYKRSSARMHDRCARCQPTAKR